MINSDLYKVNGDDDDDDDDDDDECTAKTLIRIGICQV